MRKGEPKPILVVKVPKDYPDVPVFNVIRLLWTHPVSKDYYTVVVSGDTRIIEVQIFHNKEIDVADIEQLKSVARGGFKIDGVFDIWDLPDLFIEEGMKLNSHLRGCQSKFDENDEQFQTAIKILKSYKDEELDRAFYGLNDSLISGLTMNKIIPSYHRDKYLYSIRELAEEYWSVSYLSSSRSGNLVTLFYEDYTSTFEVETREDALKKYLFLIKFGGPFSPPLWNLEHKVLGCRCEHEGYYEESLMYIRKVSKEIKYNRDFHSTVNKYQVKVIQWEDWLLPTLDATLVEEYRDTIGSDKRLADALSARTYFK